jgi:hypothetical protein
MGRGLQSNALHGGRSWVGGRTFAKKLSIRVVLLEQSLELEQVVLLLASVREDFKDLSDRIQKESMFGVQADLFPVPYERLKHLVNLASGSLPEHAGLFQALWQSFDSTRSGMLGLSNIGGERGFFVESVNLANQIVDNIAEFIKYEQEAEATVRHTGALATAEEKEKDAARSLEKEDYVGVMQNLNAALELALKDQLNIPTSIAKISASKMMRVLISNKVGPYMDMDEVSRHLLRFDNEGKHRTYLPTKTDCIRAMKSVQDLFAKLRAQPLRLEEDLQNKIYSEV